MHISELILLLSIFVLHYIGDYVLQTREMAENKSHSLKFLSMHVMFYVIPFLIAYMIFDVLMTFNDMPLDIKSAEKMAYGIIWFFFSHWFIDMFTSKMSHNYHKKNKTKPFWLTIGFDQLLHNASILIGYYVWFHPFIVQFLN